MEQKKLKNNGVLEKEKIINRVNYTLLYYAAIVLNILISDTSYWNFAWKLVLLEVFVVILACVAVKKIVNFSKCKIWHFVIFEAVIIIINMLLIR